MCILKHNLYFQTLLITIPNAEPDRWDEGLHNNKTWSAAINRQDPTFFPTLALAQKPQILWFGCSDSRVPETTLLGLKPGDVFVHRCIANIVKSKEVTAHSVLDYAIDHLKNEATGEHYIRDIVVCGHTNCGGCAAAMADTTDNGGPIDAWLRPLRALRKELTPQWDIEGLDEEARKKALIVANVVAGVKELKALPNVAEAMEKRRLQLHGAVYSLESGLVREIRTSAL